MVPDIDKMSCKEYNYYYKDGNVTVQRDRSGVDLADINPFRYRGYIYDYEFGLYYLQSRYYDPELCRFVNADEPVLVGAGNSIIPNLYAYCDNDSVNKVDPTGYFGFWTTLLLSLGAGIALGLWKLSKERKKKTYKEALESGKLLMGIIAFFLGFLQGFLSVFFLLLSGNILIAIVMGIISLFIALIKEYYDVFIKGQKVSEGVATDAFIEGFSGKAISGTPTETMFSFANLLTSKNFREFVANFLKFANSFIGNICLI